MRSFIVAIRPDNGLIAIYDGETSSVDYTICTSTHAYMTAQRANDDYLIDIRCDCFVSAVDNMSEWLDDNGYTVIYSDVMTEASNIYTKN